MIDQTQIGVNYGMRIFINTSSNPLDPSVDPVWAELGDGINNITEALNENIVSGYYLNLHGWGATEVTAMNPSFQLSGIRKHGDAAQDWIFKKKFKMLNARKTQMKVQCFNPENEDVMYDTYMCDVTISNLQEYSGATEAGSGISMTVNFNGAPVPMVVSPKVSVSGNNTSSVSITATAITEDSIIRYTVGTTEPADPTESSSVYSTAIVDTTEGTKIYKFRAFKDDFEPSDVVSKTVVVTA